MKTGYGTVQRAQLAESALREKTAALQKDRAGLVVAERKIDVLTSERAKAEAQRDRNLATQHQAELNLSYTSIIAPVDGTVGARALRVGQYVQAGTALMAVVPLDAVYVVANYKETQLANVRAIRGFACCSTRTYCSHVRELRLLVVGDDIDRVERHHGHQRECRPGHTGRPAVRGRRRCRRPAR